MARGEVTAGSDVHVVVTFKPGGLAGFGFLSAADAELGARFGYQVGFIEQGAIDITRRIDNLISPIAMDRDARTVYEIDPAAS